MLGKKFLTHRTAELITPTPVAKAFCNVFTAQPTTPRMTLTTWSNAALIVVNKPLAVFSAEFKRGERHPAAANRLPLVTLARMQLIVWLRTVPTELRESWLFTPETVLPTVVNA